MLELTRLVQQHPRQHRSMPLLLGFLLGRHQKHEWRSPQSSTLRPSTWIFARARRLDLLQILPRSATCRATSPMPALYDKQITIAPSRPAPLSRTTRCIASACSVLATDPRLSPRALKVAPRAGSTVSARHCPVHASSPGSCVRLGSRGRHRYALRKLIRWAYFYIRLLFWSMNRVRTG